MLPKVVIYNSVSVDGAIKDFDVDIALHYEVASRIGADAMLGGSNTVKTGIELFMKTVPPEEEQDFSKPKSTEQEGKPLIAVADSRGILKGLLHVYRKSGYWRDLIILVSKATPNDYLDYLKARNYDFVVAGNDHVDLQAALQELRQRYGVKTIATDTGGVLAGILLDNGLVDEVQLLISPQIVGSNAVNLFRTVTKTVKLGLIKSERVNGSHVLLSFKVLPTH